MADRVWSLVLSTSSDLIQSRDNPLVKRIYSLQRSSFRNRERAFIIEGVRAVEDMAGGGFRPEVLVLSDDFDPARLPNLPGDVPVRTMARSLFNDLSDTATPQGILAIAPMQTVPPGPAEPQLTVIADGISDPGNLGTLLRSCAGTGVTTVYLTPNTVDPYNPKVVRSAMGAHFRVPVSRLDASNAPLFAAETAVVVSDAGGSLAYDEVDMTGPTVIVVGSETGGVSASLRDAATAIVAIPMATDVDSLNAAIAGSILLFEAHRQRRTRIRAVSISA